MVTSFEEIRYTTPESAVYQILKSGLTKSSQSIEQRRTEPTLKCKEGIVYVVVPEKHRYDNTYESRSQQKMPSCRPFSKVKTLKSLVAAKRYISYV